MFGAALFAIAGSVADYRQFVTGDFTGDGRVQLVDFAIFAAYWLGTDGGFYCTGGGNIDLNDLKEFAENRLAGAHGNAPEARSSGARLILGQRYKSFIDNR